MSAVAGVRALTKHYRGVTALADVDIDLTDNVVYGLLGRNGAGKTTLMRLLAAHDRPSSGTVAIFGEQPYENPGVVSRICFVGESRKYPAAYSVRHVLAAGELLYDGWDADYARRLVEEFRLPLTRAVAKLSRGMLSALGIVVGLASRAPLTLFDEPYLGLDAVARQRFYELLLADYLAHPGPCCCRRTSSTR